MCRGKEKLKKDNLFKDRYRGINNINELVKVFNEKACLTICYFNRYKTKNARGKYGEVYN